jgi:hypothetical protein
MSYSNYNSPYRSSHRPLSGISSNIYTESILVDILSKREYIYRQYFHAKSYKPLLNNYFLSSPTNPILLDIKNTAQNIDPISISSEISRDLFYNDLSLVRLMFFKDLFFNNNFTQFINVDIFDKYLISYMLGRDEYNTLKMNHSLYKNQYRPMKKGVSNMIKLHATGAVAMPTEIRLHILASSKDVIHSWAIPSAGIKIDCVPGYSSHRVAIFFVSGIF